MTEQKDLGRVRIGKSVTPEVRSALELGLRNEEVWEEVEREGLGPQIAKVLVGNVVERVTLQGLEGTRREVLTITVEDGRQVTLFSGTLVEDGTVYSNPAFEPLLTSGVNYGL